MTFSFLVLAVVTLAGAVATMMLRNLVHCALALTVSFAGLAGVYLHLDAQFVGFAQILVYIGAVAILIVFPLLLTRGAEPTAHRRFSSGGLVGAAIAAAIFGLLSSAILGTKALVTVISSPPQASVRQIGDLLMTKYVLPLEVLGPLLTAALIGAAIIAMQEREGQ